MNLRSLALIATLIAVCSCSASQDDQQAAADKAVKDATICTQGELTRANALQRRDCFDQTLISELGRAGYSHMDWLYGLASSNRSVAVAYADGQISQDEYKRAIQENAARFNAANNQVNSGSSEVNPNWVHDFAVMQQQQYENAPPLFQPHTHCTSYSLGDHVYTDCQ